jgi:histidine triad (HIT) family protein
MNWLGAKVCLASLKKIAEKAKEAQMTDCIFCKISRGEIPSKKIYEDDDVYAFHDINPVAPVHFMLIPKLHLVSLMEADESHAALLGKMLVLAPKLAKEQGLDKGFRTVINSGKGGGQEVFHLHVHVIGGGNIPPMVRRD